MKLNKTLIFTIVVLLSLAMVTGLALAEDGLIFRRNISKTPELETEKAAIYMMDFYVPAQASDGSLYDGGMTYLIDDGAEGVPSLEYSGRDYAKPLVTVYIDGEANEHFYFEEASTEMTLAGGIVLGAFDAYAGVSLDDGTSWKTTNLSRSADLSSFTTQEGFVYPGGVHAVVHQVAGDRILVTWASKYCDGGSPLYTLDPLVEEDAAYLTQLAGLGLDPVYLTDLFGVAGTQRSVDYTLQGYPDVGEVPFSCVWAARGKLVPLDDPTTTELIEKTHVIWTKPERLTSGRRDANLPAVDCAGGAGCILIWQEDPEGLRPGQGLGPGEGWSGAVANQQTDMWYSYIGWEDFDKILVEDATTGTFSGIQTFDEFLLTYTAESTMPKVGVPMAMPLRLTDNAMCKADVKYDTNGNLLNPYCYYDFETSTQYFGVNSAANFCASSVSWTNPGGTTLNICQTQDGRVLNGRIAATRTRLNLKPYTTNVDADGDGVLDKSAWVIMAYEENKAMGDMIDPITLEPLDIGKDIWYHSFDMFKPDIVAQGGMLNQPAVDRTTGQFFEMIEPVDEWAYPQYQTEISRRFALTTNSVTDIADPLKTPSGLSAMLIYKQGIINQGGPADIMLRRVVVPDEFDPAVDNPYAFENMDCPDDGDSATPDGWVLTDGSNPNYLKGVCLSPAINITANTIIACDNGASGDACADTFPVADDGSIPIDIESFPKVTEWRQCDGLTSLPGCTENDLDDQPWENPFDVAKGHRGFLDGDIVMMMYAWAPNWKANTVGNDHYNLYVRRSFDGGLTWTTTPAYLGGDGTTTCEWYGLSGLNSDDPPYEVCTLYGAGEFEQGRNVSLLVGNKITILDPRYSPSGGLKLYPTIRTDWLDANADSLAFTSDDVLPYADDAVRDSSKFFVVYETGDNTTVEEGEAVPLDLFYSRGTAYGDDYEVMEYYTSDGEVKLYWPWLENKQDDLSGEASVVANPGGTFMYAVWNQWKEEILEDGSEVIFDADMIFRRLLYLPDDSTQIVTLAPAAYIVYSSTDTVLIGSSETLTFAGIAKDYSGTGIVRYSWRVDDSVDLSSDQIFTLAANDLTIGTHTISFAAMDGNGKWSRTAAVTIYVVNPDAPVEPEEPEEPTGPMMLFIPVLSR